MKTETFAKFSINLVRMKPKIEKSNVYFGKLYCQNSTSKPNDQLKFRVQLYACKGKLLLTK